MKKSVLAFILAVVAGLVGIYVGAMLNMEGYLGIVLSVATIGAFVISVIDEKNSNQGK